MAVLPEQQDESLFSPADPPPHPAVSPSTIRIKRKKKRKKKALVHAPVHRNVMN